MLKAAAALSVLDNGQRTGPNLRQTCNQSPSVASKVYSKTATGQRHWYGTRVVLTGNCDIPRLHKARLMSGLTVVNQLRQNTNSCRNQSRFNFAVGIFDSFRQAREVVTLSLQVFVAYDTFGKCGRQSKFGTQQ